MDTWINRWIYSLVQATSAHSTCQVPNKRCQLLVLNGLTVPTSSLD